MSKEKIVRKNKSLADVVAEQAAEAALLESVIPEIEVVTPVIEEPVVYPETEYPAAQDLTELYNAGLLPSNNVPAAHTLQSVAAEGSSGKPLAVLVESTGEVLPVPIPYIASPSAKPLYTIAEMEKYQVLYEEREQARVQEMLLKNTKPKYDHTATPPVKEETEDDLYGEPMSQAVAASFPNAGKK